MLQIRAEQMEMFRRNRENRMIDAAMEHVRHSLPDIYYSLGPDAVRDSVLKAKSKCLQYRFDISSAVFDYLAVMYILGFDFDEDPRYQSAKHVLADPELPAEFRIRQLLDLAIDASLAAGRDAPAA